MTASAGPHRSGFVAIVGRPNAGKSTLLNQLVGHKVAIVTDKPQTTRTRILGIKTLPEAQFVFVDTPGIHAARTLLNARMVQEAQRALEDADVVLWLVDAAQAEAGLDRHIVTLLAARRKPCCMALNKIDAVQKAALLPLMDALARALPDRDVVPVSALTGENVDTLLAVLQRLLPEGPRYYPEDELTDQSERMLAQEIIREKVMTETHEEVPYATAVTIDAFEEKPERNVTVIKATIHVERDTQKPIVIGKGGARLKRIGTQARHDLERLLERRVYLELFVRVQGQWTTDTRRLREFGL